MSLHIPHISIIIPTLNESGFIVNCVESLLLGEYPSEKIEVLIIDGGSNDGTIDQVNTLCSKHSNIRLIENPKKIVPAAMNIGVAAASNDILMWCGAHAIYDKTYIKNSVRTLLEESNAASVGGVITPIANTRTGKAIAIATSHKFGIGNAQYRIANKRQTVDTVFGGCFYKSSVLKIGGFNENWIRNQDYEFNHRLRSLVGPIVLDPNIRCQYFCRESISALWKQYYHYGFWRLNTLIKHPSSFRLRQAAPVLLCFGLGLSLILIVKGSIIGLIIPIAYTGIGILISCHMSLKKKQASLLIYLPIIFATLHLSWGLGFIKNSFNTIYLRLLKR